MARRLTYLGITTFMAAAFAAACGGGGNSNSGDGDGDGGDGDGGDGDEICVVNCGDGDAPGGDGDISPFPEDSIRYFTVPEGFTSDIDDGSGNAVFVEVGFDEAVISTIQAGAGGAADPEAVFFYPLADTMVPGNLTFLNFQWKVPDGSYDKVMFRATTSDATFHAYVTATCTNSGFCSADMPGPEWQHLGKNYGGETVNFEIISTNGTDVNVSQTLPITFSPESLIGALYYWASKTRNIKRVSFGAEAAIDFIIPGENVDYACVSCHSVSRDGTTIAFGVSPEHGENISAIQVAPTNDPGSPYIAPTNGTTPFSAAVSNGNTEGPIDSLGHNVALNYDGSIMAVNTTSPPDNWPTSLEVRGTAAADDIIATYTLSDSNPFPFGLNNIGIHPEYSPDSSQLVVTLANITPSTPASAWANTAGSIATLPVMADGTLGQATELAVPADGAFLFYPTWSPDSQYVAFMASWDQNNNVGSLSNEHAVMYMVPTSGGPYTCPGAGCIELTRGTGYGAAEGMAMSGTTASTWPKFAPFAQGAAGNVYFITFTSRRNIGATTGSTSQLWMFGVDTSLLPADPSFSPFWLPYQDTQDGSLTPYWTEVEPCNIEGGTCNGCLPALEVCLVNQDTNVCQCEPLEVAR